VLYLVASRFFSPPLLIVLLAGGRAWNLIRLLSKPRPDAPPPGFLLWPRWFSTPLLRHIRLFGGLYVIGLLADSILHSRVPELWD